MSHNRAWRQEKARRWATLHRKDGMANRQKERLALERQWLETRSTRILTRLHCRFYLHGKCKYGDQCWYRHNEAEKEIVRMEKQVRGLLKRAGDILPSAETPKL